MKKLIPIILLFTACTKQNPLDGLVGKMTYTMAVDSIVKKEGNKWVTYNLVGNPNWRYQFWYSDGKGYTFPATDNQNHGVRYTPENPAIPNGPRTAVKFTWTIENGTRKANIGGNPCEIYMLDGDTHCRIYQPPVPGNDAEQNTYLHLVPNGDGMNGKGVILPG